MELKARVSAKIVHDDRVYEFTFPNGAEAQEALQALAEIHKHVVDLAKKNNENKNEDGEEKDNEECQECDGHDCEDEECGNEDDE